ncbi:RGS4 [Acrasis kona]|uniref:RGS4 n=1 Tax=Acrasis kona TaxID=1008807 RepID=A0AAW2YVN8_9EUKA
MVASSSFIKYYEVQLELVLQVPKALNHLHQYLKSCYNEDGLSFLIEVEEYKLITDLEKKMTKADDIVNKFVKFESPYEINIDSASRNEIVQKTKLTNSLFEPITNVVFRELNLDAFSRYVRSKELKTFLSFEGERFTSSISLDLRKAGSMSQLLCQPKVLKEKFISDRDICFIMYLNQDTSDWKCVHRGSDYASYISKSTYTCGSMRDLKLGKATGVLEYNIEDCLEMLNSDKREYDGQQAQELKTIYIPADEANDNPYSFVCRNYVMSMTPFHARRRLPLIGTVVRDGERNAYHLIFKTTTSFNDVMPPVNGALDCSMFSGYSLFKISDTTTRYVHSYYIDVRAAMADLLVKKLAIDRARQHQKKFKEILLNMPPGRRTDNAMRKCLEDFTARYGDEKVWKLN